MPPKGCRDEDLLRLVNLCPFLASEKSDYDDDAVLALLRRNPKAACLRHAYRCGLGINSKVHPLALVVALGGSLEVVQLMVRACPEALNEKLSRRRNVLHYAIAEGADIDIVRYLTSQNTSLVLGLDSFQALPLHLASTYPSSLPSVLHYLLQIHPDGAKSLDHKSMSPLHRACRSRADLEKVLALIDAFPEAIFLEDWARMTPLDWAERMDLSLSDPIPEVVEILGMVEDIMRMGNATREIDNGSVEEQGDTNANYRRAQQILAHFRSNEWRGGIRLAFARNDKLVSLLNIPNGLLPELLSHLGTCEKKNTSDTGTPSFKYSMESLFSVLVQCPDALGNT